MIAFTGIYLLFCFCFFLIFKKFSSLINVYDMPNERKFHKEKISLAGGVYIFVCAYSFFLLAIIFNLNSTEIFFSDLLVS